MRRIWLLTALLAIACPATVAAATYVQWSSVGVVDKVVTGADGAPRSFALGWAADCSRDEAIYSDRARFSAPFRRVTRMGVADRVIYSAHGVYHSESDVNVYRAEARVKMRAIRNGPYGWSGTVTGQATVRRPDQPSIECSDIREPWQALIPDVKVHLKSEPGDYIGAGATYDDASPKDHVPFSSTPRHVHAEVEGFRIDVQAPDGERLERGTTFPTHDYSFGIKYPGPEGGLTVEGDGRACDATFGRVDVTRGSYTSHGLPKHLRLSFEQHCDTADAPALRGTIVYRP